MRNTDVADMQGIFRIIQSAPSGLYKYKWYYYWWEYIEISLCRKIKKVNGTDFLY